MPYPLVTKNANIRKNAVFTIYSQYGIFTLGAYILIWGMVRIKLLKSKVT